MTDDDQRYDELRRRLADEGQASAPHDLAPEVMRRVRSEPRRKERRFLRPALTLVAAAALVLAAVLGISRLGNGSASSSSSGGGEAASQAQAPMTAAPSKDANGIAAQKTIVRHVAVQSLGPIFDQVALPACPPGNRFSASVPAPQLRQVADRLRSAAAGAAAGADTRDVELHRAPKGQARIRITCP
ncbi:MAG TPA: hypothetical protein VFJ66_04055 [Gaiellales bacterium]|nr:hypothetical protein [Gaiellales bacterium]